MANGTRDQFVQLLVLDFFASSIYLFPKFQRYPEDINSFTQMYSWPQAEIVFGLLSRPELEVGDYIKILNLCEITLRDLHVLTEAIDFVADILLKNYPTPAVKNEDSTAPGYATGFQSDRIFTLQKLCHQRRSNTERYIERLNRTFEGQNKAINRQESNGVKRLTLLATIFLPLSLSASILSMNNRFVDLKLLLFDFFGVFIIVGSLAIIIQILVRIALKIKTITRYQIYWDPRATWMISKGLGAPLTWSMKVCSILLSIYYIIMWVVLLVSSIVGMILDAKKGLKILLFGFAGLLGYGVIGYGLLICVILSNRYY